MDDETPIRHPYLGAFSDKILKTIKIPATLDEIIIETSIYESAQEDMPGPSSPHHTSHMHTSPSEARIIVSLERQEQLIQMIREEQLEQKRELEVIRSLLTRLCGSVRTKESEVVLVLRLMQHFCLR